MKKKWKIGLIILLLFVLSLIMAGAVKSLKNRQTAINVAEKYLEEKYSTEMQIHSVKYKYLDAHGLIRSYFYVYAAPKSNPGIRFYVVLDATTFSPVYNDFGYRIPDNYIQTLFSHWLAKTLGKTVTEFWGKNARAEVSLFGEFQNTENLSETDSIELMSQSIEYELRIITERKLEDCNFEEETDRILQVFDEIKQLNVGERKIYIKYRNWDISFSEWSDVTKDDVMTKLMRNFRRATTTRTS